MGLLLGAEVSTLCSPSPSFFGCHWHGFCRIAESARMQARVQAHMRLGEVARRWAVLLLLPRLTPCPSKARLSSVHQGSACRPAFPLHDIAPQCTDPTPSRRRTR